MDNVSEYKYLTAAAPSSGGEASTASWSRTTPNCFIAPILVDFLRSSAAFCGNSRHYDKDQLEEIVMQEVKETILDAGYLEEYYQQCLEEMKKEEAESTKNIRLLQQQQRDLEERIDQALEMMLDRRLPKDKLVSKLQGDEKRLAEITDELEHYGAKTIPNQRDLDTFRQQLNEALDQDFDIRKTALHTLIRKIEVDEDGQLDFDFYLASDVLASTPTAVQTPATSAYSYLQTWQYSPARV